MWIVLAFSAAKSVSKAYFSLSLINVLCHFDFVSFLSNNNVIQHVMSPMSEKIAKPSTLAYAFL